MAPIIFTFKQPQDPKKSELKHASTVLKYGIESVVSLAKLLEKSTQSRGQGAPTQRDQDILRAMVVMSGSTLDAVTKRIIQDFLPQLIKQSSKPPERAVDLIRRRIINDLTNKGGSVLATALLSDNMQNSFIEYIIEELLGTSYQSVNQILAVCSFLDIQPIIDKTNKEDAQTAFDVRNQIVHEMDATPEESGKGKRKRRPRKREDMYKHAKTLLVIANTLIQKIDKKNL